MIAAAEHGRSRKRQYWGSYDLAIGGGLAGGIMARSGVASGLDALTLAGLAVIGLSLAVAMVLYHRSMDEHERSVVLWANSVTLYLLLLLLLAAETLSQLANPITLTLDMCIMIAAGAGIATFLWRKYF